jgi:argonaute-like protein implicated in RNA metabolism and viral defense
MTPQKRLEQLAAAEGHHSDKGYMLGSQADYEAFVAKRNRPQPKQLTQEEVLHELWYLRRRVRQLEQQLSDKSWQTNPDRQGGSFTQSEIDNATAWR